MMERKRRIALGDLGHTTKLLANNFVPLNIGFIAGYLEARFPGQLDIRLFKDAPTMLAHIRAEIPDLVATSNYLWNTALGHYVLKTHKTLNPRAVAVTGGPNFPKDRERVKDWLGREPHLDFVVENEGETSMAALVERLFANDWDLERTKEEPIAGCFFLGPDGGFRHAPFDMLRDLDAIPSPYLSGRFDDFLLNGVAGHRLLPMIEGSRGCPFACTFCRAGVETNKIRQFDTERLCEEVDYIGRLYRKHGLDVVSLLITDQNFGILRRDALIADRMREVAGDTGFPRSVMATSGKTNADVVLDTMARFDGISMTMSVQSTDPEVLNNIKRTNFPIEKFQLYQHRLRAQNKLSKSDVILGLPGDSLETHLQTLRDVVGWGLDVVDCFTFMMLLGTEAEFPEEREKWGYRTRWRLPHGGFSRFGDDVVLESEEVCIATHDMSFEDYVRARGIDFLLVTLFNGTVFWELKALWRERGLDPVALLLAVEKRLMEGEGAPRDVFASFRDKTRSELFDSQDAMETFYRRPGRFEDLAEDRVGENLMQKHRYRMFLVLDQFAALVLDEAREMLGGDEGDEDVLGLLMTRARAVARVLSDQPPTAEAPLTFELDHDVPGWRRAVRLANGTPAPGLETFRAPTPLAAFYPDDRLALFRRQIVDGGTEPHQKARTFYRLGVESLMPEIVPCPTP